MIKIKIGTLTGVLLLIASSSVIYSERMADVDTSNLGINTARELIARQLVSQIKETKKMTSPEHDVHHEHLLMMKALNDLEPSKGVERYQQRRQIRQAYFEKMDRAIKEFSNDRPDIAAVLAEENSTSEDPSENYPLRWRLSD